jgi:acetylornithine deacetylase/succinyl-diaminopimelate desuccinylase-like protein
MAWRLGLEARLVEHNLAARRAHRAHAVDEWVAADELVALARIIPRVLVGGSPA